MLSSSLRRSIGVTNAVKQHHRLSVVAVRHRTNLPMNTVVAFVPQQEAWIVERMGKFHSVLSPGINILLPILDKIKYVQSLKEIAIDIPQQSAITSDNVHLDLDGVLYLRILDPYKTSYGVEDAQFAITQIAQTTMRSELGKIALDNVFRERESLNVAIVQAINIAAEPWGITCLRYEIRDIKLPTRVQDAMHRQVEAEREKRAAVLKSEGVREADINVAEGQRQARILASEAEMMERINTAKGQAQSLDRLSEALQHEKGANAASLSLASSYISAFAQLAQKSNTLILPANTGDVTSSVASATAIYHKLAGQVADAKQLEAESKD